MTPVREGHLEEALLATRQARAMQAVASLQRHSVERGLHRLGEDEIEARIRNARGFTAMAVAGGILVTSTAPPPNRALLPLRFYFALTTDDNGVSTIHAYPWEVLVKLYEILE
jgi:hypothetical protein